MKNYLLGASLLIGSSIIIGCSSQPKLTQEAVFNQYTQVAKLKTELDKSRENGAELLAPESHKEVSTALQHAIASAERNETKAANTAASTGLKNITVLNRHTESSQKILSEVLHARKQAIAAGVLTLQSKKLADLDADLKATGAMVENGKIEKAKQRRPDLIKGYTQLELEVLKQGKTKLAKAAIENARQNDAEKYAPKTFSRAEEQLTLAMKILDADRTQISKADIHAKDAKWLAEQSSEISETVKDFDRRDYSMEDVVLWHQQALTEITQPLGGTPGFNKPADTVVYNLKTTIAKVVKERDSVTDQYNKTQLLSQSQLELSQSQLKATEEKYGKKIAATEKQRLALVEKEQANKIKFDKVQAMFSAREANVYRQRENILISAQGFVFPSGTSEIQTENFPLMNKIIRATKLFPGARIEVNGHTDSVGADTINKKLSEERAEKVARFLTEVGEITASKITSRGFGETRPVATNETPAGRAENRRVEIKIINE